MTVRPLRRVREVEGRRLVSLICLTCLVVPFLVLLVAIVAGRATAFTWAAVVILAVGMVIRSIWW